MSEHLQPESGEEMPKVRVTRFSNPIRDAMFEATYGDRELALAIARGEIEVVHEIPGVGPTILFEGDES